MNGQIIRDEKSISRRRREDKIVEHKRDYRDAIKQYVRKHFWLPIAENRLQTINRIEDRKLRYFTLCAEEAIDIHLFGKTKLIDVEETGYPTAVYCECYPEQYEAIAANLGRTVGILGYFEDLVNKRGTDISREFYNMLPFDVYNLDFTGVCFPSCDPPFSNTMRAIKSLIDYMGSLQSRFGFDILFTFRAERSKENTNAIRDLVLNQQENIDAYQWYKDEVDRKNLNFASLSTSKYYEFLLYSLPKVIGKWGKDVGFQVRCPSCVYYPRPSLQKINYYIISFVVSFERHSRHRQTRRTELNTTDPINEITNSYFSLLREIVNSEKINIGTIKFDHIRYEKEVTDILENVNLPPSPESSPSAACINQ